MVWFAVAKISKMSSLAALTAAATTPVFAWVRGYPTLTLLIIVAMVAMLFWRHRSNIRKLLEGSESRIGKSASSPDPDSES